MRTQFESTSAIGGIPKFHELEPSSGLLHVRHKHLKLLFNIKLHGYSVSVILADLAPFSHRL
jgi:hypothetical protein